MNVPGQTKRRAAHPRETEAGFTLIELLVVIVIIGLLATIVIINVMPAQDTARQRKAEADVATLEQAIEMYRLNRLNYPDPGNGLEALVHEGFIKRLPKDPWGNPYHYGLPGRTGEPFEVYSLGADGREGGTGRDADIGNWK
jgi:general secretion pathway protein G